MVVEWQGIEGAGKARVLGAAAVVQARPAGPCEREGSIFPGRVGGTPAGCGREGVQPGGGSFAGLLHCTQLRTGSYWAWACSGNVLEAGVRALFTGLDALVPASCDDNICNCRVTAMIDS